MPLAYLVQSGKIRKPLNDYNMQPLKKRVAFNAMGSSEFEFGALNYSLMLLRVFNSSQDVDIRISKRVISRPCNSVIDNKPGEQTLNVWILHGFTEGVLDEYVANSIQAIFNNKAKLKQLTGFEYNAVKSLAENDFFWDIENHVMWSTNKQFMNRLLIQFRYEWATAGPTSII